jgi:hypothetical protein
MKQLKNQIGVSKDSLHRCGRRSRRLDRQVAILLLCGLLFWATGCKTNTMSVQEAQDVAIEFQASYKTVPPRGLGATIERSVAYYKDTPQVPKQFLVPQKKYTDAELKNLYNGYDPQRYRAAKFYTDRSYDEFLRGNLSLALRIVDVAPSLTTFHWMKASAYTNKAIFLATAGDYRAAQIALTHADGHFGSYKNKNPSHGPTHARYLLTVVHITSVFVKGV